MMAAGAAKQSLFEVERSQSPDNLCQLRSAKAN